MNSFEIVLKGGLKGCCSVYPASMLRSFLKDWFKPEDGVSLKITDIELDYWESDDMADKAYKLLKESAFPLVYMNDILIVVSKFPDKEDLIEWIKKTPTLEEQSLLQLKMKMEEIIEG